MKFLCYYKSFSVDYQNKQTSKNKFEKRNQQKKECAL